MTDERGEPQHTADGHHVVVDGRRWRASDPGIPAKLRAELVSELSAARRAVRSVGDAARPRVQDAKVALGERGRSWWEASTPAETQERLQAAIRALLRHRGESTICPSDVARIVGGDGWRSRMDDARKAAMTLRSRDVVIITQGGEPISGEDVRGPVRIGRGRDFPLP